MAFHAYQRLFSSIMPLVDNYFHPYHPMQQIKNGKGGKIFTPIFF